MEFILDEDLKAVLEFMQSQIPASKLLGIADALPQVAKLLWAHLPQELCTVASLFLTTLPNQ